MKIIKPFLTIILMFFVICSTTGAVFADSSGFLTVQFNKQSADIGDQVQLTVTAYNTGTVGWNNVIISIPVPEGLQYLSHYTTISKADYSPSSGVWNVGNMRHDSNGKTKTLYISFEVLPSAEGKTITATGHFTSITLETTSEQFAGNVSAASPDSLKININETGSDNSTGNSTSDGTGNGTGDGTGNGTGNDTGNGTGDGTAPVYQELFGDIVNSDKQVSGIGDGMDEKINTLQSSGGGGSQGKKAYEVNKTSKAPETSLTMWYGLLAGLLVVGLIGTGYFKGMRGK